MALPYVRRTWADDPSTSTPLSAANFNAMELGIQDLSDALVTGAAWTSYTPTLTNVTLGNGTLAGRYARVGKFIYFTIVLTFGNSTSFTGQPNLTLPVTAVSASQGLAGQSLHLLDSGTALYFGILNKTSTTTIVLEAIGTASTYASVTAVSATIPFTWTTNDTVYIGGSYEAA